MKRRCLAWLMFLFSFPLSAFGEDIERGRSTVFFYGGASTSASLLNIIKVSIPDLGGYYLTSFGGAYEVIRSKYLSLELEGQISKHLEQASAFSVGTVLMLRWTVMPWDRIIPGSFGIGNGLSYSTELLQVETSAIEKTFKLLYQIILEYEFRFGRSSSWSGFIRDHHRSGIFGLFDGVTGGSDFICLGVRYRF